MPDSGKNLNQFYEPMCPVEAPAMNADGEVFTSVAQMEYLIDYQYEFSGLLRNHIQTSKEMLKVLRDVGEDLSTVSQRGLCSWNPNNNTCRIENASFLAVAKLLGNRRKMVYYISQLSSKRKELLDYVATISKRLPRQEDLDGASIAILRLQDIYNLDPMSFIKMTSRYGGMHDEHPRMHLDDLFYLGRQAYLSNNMALTAQWMRLALRSLNGQTTKATANEYSLGRSSKSVNYEIDIRDHLVYAEYRVSSARKDSHEIKQLEIK
eukprot:gene12292-13557_t